MSETTFEHSTTTTAPPSVIWEHYRDVAGWPAWNTAVRKVELSGPFVEGATGTLTAPDAGELPFRIVAVVDGVSYTSETEITDTVTLRTTAFLASLPGGGTRITHRTELVGPAAPFFADSFGPQLAAGLPVTVSRLADRAAEAAEVRS
jgi:Polyketide cyclase / dehydrase and lipid transport